MFVRIDRDLSVNIGNIFSYKLSEDQDSYKLQVWSETGNIVHTVIYLKDRPEQMKLLIEFNNVMRDLTTNLDVIRPVDDEVIGPVQEEPMIEEIIDEEPKHVQEKLDI